MVETLCISLLAGSILVPLHAPSSTDADVHDFICMALVFIYFFCGIGATVFAVFVASGLPVRSAPCERR